MVNRRFVDEAPLPPAAPPRARPTPACRARSARGGARLTGPSRVPSRPLRLRSHLPPPLGYLGSLYRPHLRCPKLLSRLRPCRRCLPERTHPHAGDGSRCTVVARASCGRGASRAARRPPRRPRSTRMGIPFGLHKRQGARATRRRENRTVWGVGVLSRYHQGV